MPGLWVIALTVGRWYFSPTPSFWKGFAMEQSFALTTQFAHPVGVAGLPGVLSVECELSTTRAAIIAMSRKQPNVAGSKGEARLLRKDVRHMGLNTGAKYRKVAGEEYRECYEKTMEAGR
jgi:hypothetical protein